MKLKKFLEVHQSRIYKENNCVYDTKKDFEKEIIKIIETENIFYVTSDCFYNSKYSLATDLLKVSKKLNVNAKSILILSMVKRNDYTEIKGFEEIVSHFFPKSKINTSKEKYEEYYQNEISFLKKHFESHLEKKYKWNQNFKDFCDFHTFEKVKQYTFKLFLEKIHEEKKPEISYQIFIKHYLQSIVHFGMDYWEDELPNENEAKENLFRIFSGTLSYFVDDFEEFSNKHGNLTYRQIYSALLDTSIQMKFLNQILSYLGLIDQIYFHVDEENIYLKMQTEILLDEKENKNLFKNVQYFTTDKIVSFKDGYITIKFK